MPYLPYQQPGRKEGEVHLIRDCYCLLQVPTARAIPAVPALPCPAFPGLTSPRLVVLALALASPIDRADEILPLTFLFAYEYCPEQFRQALPDNDSESGSFIPSLLRSPISRWRGGPSLSASTTPSKPV